MMQISTVNHILKKLGWLKITKGMEVPVCCTAYISIHCTILCHVQTLQSMLTTKGMVTKDGNHAN